MTDSGLAELRKQCIESLFATTDNVLKYLNEEKDEELRQLKLCLKEYCLSEDQQNVEDQVLNDVKEEFDVSNIDSFDEIFYSRLKASLQLNLREHPQMVLFENKIQTSLTENSQSDIIVTQVDTPNVDPMTKQPIRNPVKNSNCIHIYDRDSIMNYMKRRNNAGCPVAGCNSSLQISTNNA